MVQKVNQVSAGKFGGERCIPLAHKLLHADTGRYGIGGRGLLANVGAGDQLLGNDRKKIDAEAEALGFARAVIDEEMLHPFGPGIAPRERQAGERGTAREADKRRALSERQVECRLGKFERHFGIAVLGGAEIVPIHLMHCRQFRPLPAGQNQQIGPVAAEQFLRRTVRRRVDGDGFDISSFDVGRFIGELRQAFGTTRRNDCVHTPLRKV